MNSSIATKFTGTLQGNSNLEKNSPAKLALSESNPGPSPNCC